MTHLLSKLALTYLFLLHFQHHAFDTHQQRQANFGALASNITSPPTMIKQPNREQLFQVDDADYPYKLECEASGEPEPSYWWTKNGARFNYVAYDKRISQKPKSGTLIFGKSDSADEGLYQCFAHNDLGTSISNTVFLKKAELSSFPEEPPQDIYVDEGKEFSLECNPPSGYPKPVIVWMKISSTNAALHSINDTRLTVDPEGRLHFSYVKREDQLSDKLLYACGATSHHRTEYKLGRKTRLHVTSGSSGSAHHMAPKALYTSPTIVSALKGEELKLHCIFGGNPLPDIQWQKKGGSLAGSRVSYLNYGKTLYINRVDDSDEGTYECSASNGHGSQQTHAMEVTVSSAPYWIKAPNNTNVAQDESVQFECLAEGKPKPVLKWLLNGEPIDTQKRNSLRLENNVLYIDSLKKSDIGVYQCNASNIHGYAFRDFYLNVLDLPPIVIEAPEKIARAVTSSTVTLKCRVFGSPRPVITWKHDNIELSGGRYRVLEDGDLQIENLMPTDQGTYQCKAENRHGSMMREGELHVKSKTKIIQSPESVELPAGRMAIFKCNAEADPSLSREVVWLFQGKVIEIEQNPRMSKLKDDSLIINKTKELDSGNYTCVARSSLDSVNASATLTVQDVPSPPRITSLECDSFRATLQWTSTGDRRASILNYELHQNTNDSPDSWEVAFDNIAANDPRFSVSLRPWLNYTFKVYARNKIGLSGPSEISQTCTTKESQPTTNPSDVRGRGTQPNNLVISWTIMNRKEHNAPGFHYKVYWKRADIEGADWNSRVINDWKESRLVIPNQPVFVPYKIKVEAHNSIGQSTINPDEVLGYSGQDIPREAPRDFQLVTLLSASKAKFSWTPVSLESLRGRFKSYVIQVSSDKDENGPREKFLNSNVTEAEIDILKPFANNTVHILVSNDLFYGPRSNPSLVTTPEGVPDAVPHLSATAMGANALYITWKRPDRINGILLGYEIYYEEVIGTEIKDRIKRNPSINNPLETKAKLAGLKANTRYRVTIKAKTAQGEGEPNYIEVKTGDGSSVLPDKPSFKWHPLPDEHGMSGVRITWLPNYEKGKPGSSFYVQYRKVGKSTWTNTVYEAINDYYDIKQLDTSSIYEVRVVSYDGGGHTASNIEEVTTNGYIHSYSDPLFDPSWLVGLICAIIALLSIFLLVCLVKQNRGGKYLVYEKELILGQGGDDYKDTFDEYKSSATKPLRDDVPSLNSLDGSDDDSLTDYEGDKSKFEEDGSFIGEYGVKRKPDMNPSTTQKVATFV